VLGGDELDVLFLPAALTGNRRRELGIEALDGHGRPEHARRRLGYADQKGAELYRGPVKSRILFAAEWSPITTSAISWGGSAQPPAQRSCQHASCMRKPGDAPGPCRGALVPGRWLHQVLDNRRPGLRQIGAVVATATEPEHAAVTQALGEGAQV